MHPWFMKSLAIAFAGGSAVLLACTVHDDTSFPNSPQPTSTTPPTRTVVFDSGVVTLLGDGGAGPQGIGSGGGSTPDAAPAPDVAPEITLPDAGGLGATCDDVFDQTTCQADLTCYPQSDGTAKCQTYGFVAAGGFCTPPTQGQCGRGYFCVAINSIGTCTKPCHQGASGECVGSTCQKYGASLTVGYCGN